MPITSNIVKAAKEFALSRHAGDASGHDGFHINRVVSLAEYIAEYYPVVDLNLVRLIGWLHDIDDKKLEVLKGHITVPEFLDTLSIDQSLRNMIINDINCLSYSATVKGFKVTSLEGQIVQDADRLDAIGAIGIARVFAYGGSKGRPIDDGGASGQSSVDHFYDKLLKLEALMNTHVAKIMAADRTDYIKDFLNRFKSEQNF